MGMTPRAIQVLTGGNLNTLGKLAFSIGQPGQPLNTDEFDRYALNLFGAMMTQADGAILKRLIFEGHTLVLGQLRELVTDPNAAASRKLPAIEREHRLGELKRRLNGVIFERQMEPSHELLEAMMQQKESNQLCYISLERCTSREWEITMGKNKKQISIDSEKMVVKERSEIPDQFYSSELQAFEALRRRGLAMTFADMVSWEVHEKYIQQLTSHLRNDPPPGYTRPTLPQLLKADRQVFLHMIRAGVELKRLPSNLLDMDTKIMEALHSYEVGFHLLPLPKGSAKTETTAQSVPAAAAQGNQGQKGGWNNNRSQPYRAKGGGKGKQKGSKGASLLPKFLLGRDNTGVDAHGRRLCFNYQMGRCNEAPDGGQCSRGFHLCCRKNCYAPHAEKDHDGKTGK